MYDSRDAMALSKKESKEDRRILTSNSYLSNRGEERQATSLKKRLVMGTKHPYQRYSRNISTKKQKQCSKTKQQTEKTKTNKPTKKQRTF